MDVLEIFLDQQIESLKTQYPQVFKIVVCAIVILIAVRKYKQWRWPNAISMKFLKKDHFHNMVQRTKCMRRVSAIIPITTYILTAHSVSFVPEWTVDEFIQTYTVFTLPGLLYTAVLQYRYTPKEANFSRRISLLVPGLLSITFAFATWESFLYGDVRFLVVSVIIYIIGPAIAEWWVFLLTEEKDGKCVRLRIRDQEDIVLPFKDFRENSNYVYIRERDKQSSAVINTRRIPIGEIQEIKIEGMYDNTEQEQ